MDQSASQDRAAPMERLLYEVNPVSFVVEQAGGASTTGTARTMEILPSSLHERCPAILGSRNEVERVKTYHLEEGVALVVR